VWSKNTTNGKYTSSLGYKAMLEEENEESPCHGLKYGNLSHL